MILRALAALALLLTGCSSPPEPRPQATAKTVACATCHPNQAKTWPGMSMARAFGRATPERMDREDFSQKNSYYHAASEQHFRMIRRGDRFFQRRHQIGFQGAETNVVEKEIHYVLGSGRHARTYLHRTSGNRLIQLPLGWYAEGGTWAMNPGFDRPDHANFQREAGYACLFCHNGYPRGVSGDPTAEAAYPAELPEGIDCERCHGDGARHVAAVQGGRPIQEVKAAIFEPNSQIGRRMELCLQCHLETTSFSLPHAVMRLGRGVFSYSPAEPLAQYAAYFDHAPGTGHDGKFEIVSAPYRLFQSACFKKSSRMDCGTCHPAHYKPDLETHFASSCQICHTADKLSRSAAHAPKRGCVGCHMPQRRTEDVVHVTMTDHKIVRRPPPAALLMAARAERVETDGVNVYRGEVVPYWPRQHSNDLYPALAQVAQKSNLDKGIARLEAAIAANPAEGAAFEPHLATALLSADQPARARAIFAKILARNPNDEGALRGLADAAESREGSLDALRRLLARRPGDRGALYQLARLTRQLADAEKALAADPESPDALNLIASIESEAGRAPDAERHYREALRQSPELAPVQENLAGLLGAQGRFDEALYHFDRALRADARSASAHFGKAAALAALGRFDPARGEAQLAVQANPMHAAAWELLGNLAARQGRWTEAGAHFRRALAAQPGFARAELGLGTVLAAQRDLPGAREHLQRAAAAGDPAVRQEAVELLGELAARGGR